VRVSVRVFFFVLGLGFFLGGLLFFLLVIVFIGSCSLNYRISKKQRM
jgi:pilus assembly protein TadC